MTRGPAHLPVQSWPLQCRTSPKKIVSPVVDRHYMPPSTTSSTFSASPSSSFPMSVFYTLQRSSTTSSLVLRCPVVHEPRRRTFSALRRPSPAIFGKPLPVCPVSSSLPCFIRLRGQDPGPDAQFSGTPAQRRPPPATERRRAMCTFEPGVFM